MRDGYTIQPCRSKTPEYRTWYSMIRRCTYPNDQSYKDYGGRGITVCERWFVFDNFLEDMGHRPAGKSLDRINNNKGYSKENCRWATATEQCRNTRANRLLTYNGVTKCMGEWAESMGIRYSALRKRLDTLPFDEAMVMTGRVRRTKAELAADGHRSRAEIKAAQIKRPTDGEVLAALASCSDFVLTNHVRELLLETYPSISAEWTLRRLKELEKVGHVSRQPTNGRNQFFWIANTNKEPK